MNAKVLPIVLMVLSLKLVDGDTIDVNNVRVRLSMVNTPERGEAGYNED